MRWLLLVACWWSFAAWLPAQQLQWQVPASAPSPTKYYWMGSFADFDQDGRRDFLRLVLPTVVIPPTLQIASGATGDTLWTHMPHWSYTSSIAHYAGDMDRDGMPDLAFVRVNSFSTRALVLYSPAQDAYLWTVVGSFSDDFGDDVLGNIDLTGDGWPDVLVTTSTTSVSDVYAYDNRGQLLYVLPCIAKDRIAISLANMGDMDGDGCDDFVVGCNDISNRGLQWLISGRTGQPIRETFGLLPGDRTSEHVSNLGDIDGDGVNDYAAWPYFSAARLIAVAYSGATGAVIRSWFDTANSVVTGEDFDQDGVNDIVSGADWIHGASLAGSTYCYSGRDGSELWRVDAVQYPPGQGSNGTRGWMDTSANLGVQPGSPYPVLAWLDTETYFVGTSTGRTRAYGGARAGQGPVTGTACTSSGTLPLIGVRKRGTGQANIGSRVTVAKTHANALAALNLAFTARPSPLDLTPLGFASCSVYVDPAVSYLRLTGTTGLDRGYAAVDLPHPLTAAAVGTDVVAQWLVFDPATLAHAATQMHALRVQ